PHQELPPFPTRRSSDLGRRARARNQIVYPRNVGRNARNRTGSQPLTPIVVRSRTNPGNVSAMSGSRRTVPIRRVQVIRVAGGYRTSDRFPKTAYRAEKIAEGMTVSAPWEAWNRNWLPGCANKII